MLRFLRTSGGVNRVHQLVAESAVMETVVNRQPAGGKALAYLPIDPIFVTIPAQAGRIPAGVEVEEMLAQFHWYRVCGNFRERTL